MSQELYNTPTLPPEKPKGSNTTLIIILVVIVLCCVCAIAIGLLWQFGDALLQALGISY